MLRSLAAATLVFCAYSSAAAAPLSIPTVLVGNPGNANDSRDFGKYGGVANEYRIGITEVTNAQYIEFLNAKAGSDPLGLYNSDMGKDTRGGITQSGVSGSFTYAARANMADKPVNYVSWYDAVRFINWLHNGQGDGDTETGSYTLLGGKPIPRDGLYIKRNIGASWVLPSESEWYKAAFHQPAAQGGDADDYWFFATKSNSEPAIATANGQGDISNPGPNVANFDTGADWRSLNGHLTTVGSAGPLSQSFYGTSDQNGNADEWTEGRFSDEYRGIRGGNYRSISLILSLNIQLPAFESREIGFRVAFVPEPSTYVLGAVALVGVFALRRML